jgi:hypothetical protein
LSPFEYARAACQGIQTDTKQENETCMIKLAQAKFIPKYILSDSILSFYHNALQQRHGTPGSHSLNKKQ